MSEIVQRFIRADNLTSEQGWQLIQWCLSRGADEFTLRFMGEAGESHASQEQLLGALAPFRCGAPKRENMTTLAGQPVRRPTDTWRLSTDSIVALLHLIRGGLFAVPSYSKDGWLEDFTIYRRGEVMLGIVSHEELICVCLTEEEHRELSDLRIVTHETTT